jgi:exosortase/archaeosortase family protein
VVLFQFFGNGAHGDIHTSSLFYWWVFQWVGPSPKMPDGVIILGLSVWLFVRNLRRQASGPREDGGWLPLAAMLGGLALHAVGYALQQPGVSIVALLLFTRGVLVFAGGLRWGRAAAFPLPFLLFAVPMGFLDAMGFHLRLWVIEAGIAQALLVGYLSLRSWRLRAAALVLSLPAVFIVNAVRNAAIAFVAQWFGRAAGERVPVWFGFLVFVLVLGLMLAALAMLRKFDAKKTAVQPVVEVAPGSTAPLPAAWRVPVIIVLAAAGVAALAWRLGALPPLLQVH